MDAAIAAAIAAEEGWLPFDRFMALALYAPGLGYYARDARQFGQMPSSGSDFVTAPELSPLFGHTLARQVAQALQATGTREVWEFGAGSGALARQLLASLDAATTGDEQGRRECGAVEYRIVELSAALRQRQQRTLAAFGARVRWLDALPGRIEGVVVGNEVLDAMPVQLLHFDGTRWFERGVALQDGRLAWADRPTALRPPGEHRFLPGAVTEIHRQAEAFVRTLAARLARGAAFFIDYGFPEHEYYHPQRHGGTLMCHRAHRADTDPLADVGTKDITAHVNFSAVALAAQDAGLHVLGYTSQARFLVNCGLPALLAAADARAQVAAQPLLQEHEMGELFKVLGLAAGAPFEAIGFAGGDRSHTL
ncbi:MAG: SAM-dependent methyltransferase [Burkholderiales bacterium]|nr:SAM-dependent methyltransferase [Burkholderiales bacterium]